MRLKRWETAAALAGATIGLFFLFSNVWGLGVGLLCADALWLLTRVEILEKPGAAGRYATVRGRLGVLKLVLLLGVYAAVMYGWVVVRNDVESNTRVALVANLALAGVAFFLLAELKRSGDDTVNWIVGARAEKHIGSLLDTLEERGWFVLHGYARDWGGDIDHIVCGQRGAYMIETKSYGFRRADIRRAAWNAAWLKEKLEVPWVTGVRSDYG